MISVIILLEEQHSDFSDFLLNLDHIISKLKKPYEIVVVANGTGNFFRSLLEEIHGLNHKMRAFEFSTPVTQAVCLKAVLKEVQGDILVICGSYQQLSFDSLVSCISYMENSYDSIDIVSPWRQKRVDPFLNQLQSRIFNWIVRSLVKTDLHDFSCTVKVCKRFVLEEIDFYGNMFRFLPVLAAARGFKTYEVPVGHFQERGKTGLYNLSDYVSRILDIFTLFFNTRFSRKPLRFFSSIGLGFMGVGTLLIGILFIQRIFWGIPIGNRSFLFVSLLIMVLGVFVSSAGLLGEIIAFTNGRHKKEYVIEKII